MTCNVNAFLQDPGAAISFIYIDLTIGVKCLVIIIAIINVQTFIVVYLYIFDFDFLYLLSCYIYWLKEFIDCVSNCSILMSFWFVVICESL